MSRTSSIRVALAVALGLSTASATGCARQATNRQVAYGVLIVAGFVVLGAAQSGYYYSSATPPPPQPRY